MRNLKKFLALVLALMMTFSLMVTVNAADEKVMDGVNDSFKEAVEVLYGMDVFTGYTDGTFAPQKNITRAEVATIVYRLATGDAGAEPKQAHLYEAGAAKFVDMAGHWAAGAVGYCANNRLVLGYDDTHFGPNDNVTATQAMTMILRAVGYGKNGEFQGPAWETNAYGRAREVGLLKNVDKTNYSANLSKPATRELIAEILFQAAQIPTVTWTMLGDYNKTDSILGSGKDNKSLGELNYGLAHYTGAIVGNQATGEDYTLLGMKAKAVYNTATPAVLVDVEIQDGQVSYFHGTTKKVYSSSDTTLDKGVDASNAGNVMLAFDYETKLDLFGHKATVWYDNRTSGGSVQFGDTAFVDVPSAYGTTYAVVDKANKVETVWADDLKTNDKTTGKTSIYTAAVAKGFNKNSAPAVESKIFDQFSVLASNTADKSLVGMYRLISNNASNTVDVVISLNQEVAQITQRNTTIKNGEYIYLGEGSSQFGDDLDTGNKGKILDVQLAPGSDVTLGDVVTVNKIVGTAYGTATCDAYGTDPGSTPYWYNNSGTPAEATTAANAGELYETSKLESAFTGTISTYKLDDDGTADCVMSVSMTDGKSYDVSGITAAHVNGTVYAWGFDTATHLIDDAVTPLTSLNTSGGVTYTFYLDEVGRFVGVGIPNDYSFLYTTFADYEIGSLGTGTISYYAYGVDWNGNIVKTNNKITSIKLPIGDGEDSAKVFMDNANGTNLAEGKYPGSGKSLADGYNLLPVTMKDQGASIGGNQIKGGANTRFMIDPNGSLTWYREGKDFGNRFVGWWDATLSNNTGAASTTWSITATDARNGFKRVYNQGGIMKADGTLATAIPDGTDNVDYLLTNDTKFIVVTGSGTADLKVDIYTGLTELLDGANHVEIAYDYARSGDNVYFLTGQERYGNVDVTKNNTIDTVILSNTNLFRYSTENLYFAAPGTADTGVRLAGNSTGHDIKQYELYNNGKAAYYWVDEDSSVGGMAATGTKNTGDFYTLAQVDTISGQPIYKAVRVTDQPNSNKVDQAYNYITVNNVETAAIGSGSGTVYKVGGAIVAPAYGKNVKGSTGTGAGDNQGTFVATNDIDTVLKLNHAISMGTAGTSGDLYDITVAIVYSGINVSCIYVTDVQPHAP